jgi:heme exporter protein C
LKSLTVHWTVAWALVAGCLALVGFYVPGTVKYIGESYLIFFFHFPSAIVCMLLFLAAGALGARYLIRRNPVHDLWGVACVEVGVLACTVTLVTGSIWARAAWGIWWDSADPRLMTVAIMWLTYAGYLALRVTLEDPWKRARFCAAFAVLAAVNVPLVYFSIRLFNPAHHPMNVSLREPEMIVTRWVGVMAFLGLYVAFVRLRYRVAREQQRLSELEEAFVKNGL